MEIRVLQTTRYRDRLIYVRRLQLEMIEFLVAYKGQVFTNHIYFKVGFLRKFLYYTKLRKDIYSEKELKNAIAISRIGATMFIDEQMEKPSKQVKPITVSLKDLDKNQNDITANTTGDSQVA